MLHHKVLALLKHVCPGGGLGGIKNSCLQWCLAEVKFGMPACRSGSRRKITRCKHKKENNQSGHFIASANYEKKHRSPFRMFFSLILE